MSERAPTNPLWLVSGLMFTQTVGWGTTFSQIGVMAGPISEDLGLARGIIFLGATLMYVCAAIGAPASGRLADRLGGLRLLVPGSVVLAVGLFVLSHCMGPLSYLLPWAFFGAVFHVGLVTAAYTGLAQALGARSVKAIGTLTLATGLCSSIFWPLTEFALGYLSWRSVLVAYSGLTLFVCLPIHIWLYRRFGHLRAGAQKEGPAEARAHIRAGAERPGQRLMIAIAAIGSFLGVGFGIVVIEVFVALGTSRVEAVFAGSFIGLAFVISRGIATAFADRMSPVKMAQFTYIALPLSFVPLIFYALSGLPLPALVAVMVAVAFGLPAGLVGLLRSVLPLYLFGSEGYGARLGVQSRATELASALAPAGFSSAMALSLAGVLGGLVALGGLAFLGTLRLGALAGPARRALKNA